MFKTVIKHFSYSKWFQFGDDVPIKFISITIWFRKKETQFLKKPISRTACALFSFMNAVRHFFSLSINIYRKLNKKKSHDKETHYANGAICLLGVIDFFFFFVETFHEQKREHKNSERFFIRINRKLVQFMFIYNGWLLQMNTFAINSVSGRYNMGTVG